MKVAERASGRRAEVHVYVEGRINALEEFGEYIDAKDKAICCYVPVEEGQNIKIRGKFSGTTMHIAYDAVVDGVYRKAGSYVSRAVHDLKNRRFDMDQFLCRTPKGILDTDMLVAPISREIATRGESVETVGTMELHLYVARQQDVTCTLSGVKRYYSTTGNIEDSESGQNTFKLIAPTFQMSFEQNSAPLDHAKLGREQRKMDARRPGTEPWAIFRFHYRRKEAITKSLLKMSYDPLSKAKTEPYTLQLEHVSPFIVSKAHKNDGNGSTRDASPIAPDVLSTTTKTAPKETATKTGTSDADPQSKPATTPPAVRLKMLSTTERGLAPDPATQQHSEANIPAQVFPKPLLKPTTVDVRPRIIENSSTNGKTDNVDSKSHDDGKIDRFNHSSKDSPLTNKDQKTLHTAKQSTSDHLIIESAKGEQFLANSTLDVASAKEAAMGIASDSAVKSSGLPPSGVKSVSDVAMVSLVPGKNAIVKNTQSVIAPIKKPPIKPASIITTTQIIQNQPATTTPPATPTKRIADPTNSIPVEIKRAKPFDDPSTPTTPKIESRVSPGAPSPRPLSIERKVADQRKKLEAMRQKRLETAKKQEELDRKMEPFKKRMAEELERLNQELMQEEAAAAEDEEHLIASTEMLAEFEKDDGGG